MTGNPVFCTEQQVMEGRNPKFEIHEAAREGNASMMETLLNENPRLTIRSDDDGRLPIHWAVAYNHRDVVNLLLARNDFDPDTQVRRSSLSGGAVTRTFKPR